MYFLRNIHTLLPSFQYLTLIRNLGEGGDKRKTAEGPGSAPQSFLNFSKFSLDNIGVFDSPQKIHWKASPVYTNFVGKYNTVNTIMIEITFTNLTFFVFFRFESFLGH